MSNLINVDQLMALSETDSSGVSAESIESVGDSTVAKAEAEAEAVPGYNTSLQESGSATREPAEVLTVASLLPKNITFEMDVLMREITYKDMLMEDLEGKMRLEKGVLYFEDCKTRTLGGELNLEGSYDESVKGNAIAEIDFKARKLDIKESAAKVSAVQTYFPIAKYASGEYSGDFKVRTELDDELSPVYASVYSKGGVKSHGVKISGFKALETFAQITKTQDYLNKEFEDIDISYEVIDGVAYIKPFDFAIDQLDGNASGTINLDQQVDFDVHMKVPSAALGEGANQIMGEIAGALSGFGVQTEVPEFIEMDIKITGDAENPMIRPNFSGMSSGTAKEVITEKINEEIDKAKEEAKAKAAEEAAKILADARKEADRIMAEAQKNVDLLKEEGYEQTDKLVSEAKGFVEKAAAKIAAEEMKKQIDKQAANLMEEAQKQADKVLSDAQKQADRLKN